MHDSALLHLSEFQGNFQSSIVSRIVCKSKQRINKVLILLPLSLVGQYFWKNKKLKEVTAENWLACILYLKWSFFEIQF